MNKTILVLAIILIVSLTLIGCTGETNKDDSKEKANGNDPVENINVDTYYLEEAKLGGLALGMSLEEVEKIVGELSKDYDYEYPSVMGAAYEREITDKELGLKLNFLKEEKDKKYILDSISTLENCKLSNEKGIKLGNTALDVDKIYGGYTYDEISGSVSSKFIGDLGNEENGVTFLFDDKAILQKIIIGYWHSVEENEEQVLFEDGLDYPTLLGYYTEEAQLGDFKIGMKLDKAIKILGEPDRKREDFCDATANTYKVYIYDDEGLQLDFLKEDNTLYSIEAKINCKLVTGKGSKIGDDIEKVRKAYKGIVEDRTKHPKVLNKEIDMFALLYTAFVLDYDSTVKKIEINHGHQN